MGSVEDTLEARMPAAEFSNILLGGPRLSLSVEEANSKTSSCQARREHRPDYPTGREVHSTRFSTSEFPTQIRHMRLSPEPFIL